MNWNSEGRIIEQIQPPDINTCKYCLQTNWLNGKIGFYFYYGDKIDHVPDDVAIWKLKSLK